MSGFDQPVRVEGLRELRGALKALGPDAAKALRVSLNRAVEDIAVDARRRVPTRTGAARASVKASSTQTAARVAAGGRKAPYFPWLDYGGKTGVGRSVHRPFRKEGRYVYPAYRSNRDDLLIGLGREITAAAHAAGLTVGTG